jgi:hypothetical protein
MVRRTSLRARPGALSFRFQSSNSNKNPKFDLKHIVTARLGFKGLSFQDPRHPLNAVNSGSGEQP